MPKNPLAALSEAPKKKKELKEALETLKQYVGEYNAAVDRLRVHQYDNPNKYSDESRKQDMQIMVNAVAKIQRFSLPDGFAEKATKHQYATSAQDEWRFAWSHYKDYQDIRRGEKTPENIFREVGIYRKLPIPAPNIEDEPAGYQQNNTQSPPLDTEEPKKTGWFNRVKNKLSEWASNIKDKASDFVSYIKEHPVRSALLIGAGVTGVAIIVVASVFTGGGAAVATAGGVAALLGGGGVASIVGGVLFGSAVVAGSAGILAKDVLDHAKNTHERERLNNLDNTVQQASNQTPSAPQKAESEAPKCVEWRKAVHVEPVQLHHVNNEHQANKTNTMLSRREVRDLKTNEANEENTHSTQP